MTAEVVYIYSVSVMIIYVFISFSTVEICGSFHIFICKNHTNCLEIKSHYTFLLN